MSRRSQTQRLWCTWESQRRNKELAVAFGAELLEINLDGRSHIYRYSVSTLLTIVAIISRRPAIVFSQCPSIVLTLLCLILRPLVGYKLVIDAHNATLEYLVHSNFFLRIVSTIVLSKADSVIVTNVVMRKMVLKINKNTLILPDKVPELRPVDTIREIERPAMIYISSFAPDEPTQTFLAAFKRSQSAFTLYVTGRKCMAKTLLQFESSKIIFTDFLPSEEYDQLILSADVLVDLTTRADCLVCGAYEALAARKPCILSDSEASRDMFSSGGFIFSQNREQDYITAIHFASANIPTLTQEMSNSRHKFETRWQTFFTEAQSTLEIMI